MDQLTGPVPYFLAPVAERARGGVVVLMEGMGVTQQLLRTCQRLAARGYVSLAPDLYHRVGGSDEARAGEIFGSLTDDQVVADVKWAVEHLYSEGSGTVALVGFCSGGRQAYVAASQLEVDGVCAFYGGGIGELTQGPDAPVLLFYGEGDEHIEPADRAAAAARHPDSTVVYPDAGHAFFRDGSELYRPVAAADAWARLTDFLDDLTRSAASD